MKKPWSISTTVRNPDRLRDFLRVLKELEGQTFNSDNQIKFGNDNGNSGGIFRYGKYLDNGIWFRTWKFRKLWLQWKLQPGYLDFGLFCICYGN